MVALGWDTATTFGDSETRNHIFIGQDSPQMGRRSRACASCHERKVRCDAAKVGTPCSRCTNSTHPGICMLLPGTAKNQRNLTRKRGDEPDDGDKRRRPRQQSKAQQSSARPHAQRVDQHVQTLQMTMSNIGPCDGDQLNVIEIAPLTSTSTAPMDFASIIDTPTLSPLHCGSSVPDQSPLRPLECGRSRSHGSVRLREHEWQVQNRPKVFQFVYEQPSLTENESSKECDKDIEYHDGTNSITILSEALGPVAPIRLVQNITRKSNLWMGQQREIVALDDEDAGYLYRKGAFTLPRPEICDKLVGLFFECVYICVPVFDRVKFMEEYARHKSSMFLLQAVLASVVPYTSMDLLNDAGFHDRSSAQEMFYFRAKLLHDFDVEKSQLRLLQGALILSITHVSHYMPRDYRYWFSNAVSVANGMGIYKNLSDQRLDQPTRRILRRIWWILYTWDVLLALHGMDTMRRFRDNSSDTSCLTEADWEEEIPPTLQNFLRPISKAEKVYLIESAKHSCLIRRFWHTFAYSTPEVAFDELGAAAHAWRQSLPSEMKITNTPNVTMMDSWFLILNARSYVCECVMYRMILHAPSTDENLSKRASRKLHSAMFELDAIIDRIIIQNSAEFNSFFLHTCISTAIALHVEKALKQSISTHERIMTTLRIQSKLEWLREISKSWSYTGRLVKMFEGVIQLTRLSMPVVPNSDIQAESYDAVPSKNEQNIPNLPGELQPLNKSADAVSNFDFFNFADEHTPFDYQMSPIASNSVLEELFPDNSEYWNQISGNWRLNTMDG